VRDEELSEETRLLERSAGSFDSIISAISAYELDKSEYVTVRIEDLRNVLNHFQWLTENRLLELMFHGIELIDDEEEECGGV